MSPDYLHRSNDSEKWHAWHQKAGSRRLNGSSRGSCCVLALAHGCALIGARRGRTEYAVPPHPGFQFWPSARGSSSCGRTLIWRRPRPLNVNSSRTSRLRWRGGGPEFRSANGSNGAAAASIRSRSGSRRANGLSLAQSNNPGDGTFSRHYPCQTPACNAGRDTLENITPAKLGIIWFN